ncbi:MAG: hypothetical protein FJ191_12665 [Gammaproteobacteria bacterium]|nr:hypothetical protein [Gammaproteobacteria bacterium]
MAKTKPVQGGEIALPDPNEWASVVVQARPVLATEPHGRVAGIDYSAWAVAWEDARQKPERLAARALALDAKGFREVTGQHLIVHGVDAPVRVWVMPRNLYEQRRQARDGALVDRVRLGLYHEAALSSGMTRATRK